METRTLTLGDDTVEVQVRPEPTEAELRSRQLADSWLDALREHMDGGRPPQDLAEMRRSA